MADKKNPVERIAVKDFPAPVDRKEPDPWVLFQFNSKEKAHGTLKTKGKQYAWSFERGEEPTAADITFDGKKPPQAAIDELARQLGIK